MKFIGALQCMYAIVVICLLSAIALLKKLRQRQQEQALERAAHRLSQHPFYQATLRPTPLHRRLGHLLQGPGWYKTRLL